MATVAAALMFPLAQVPATAATEDFPADGSWLVPAGVSIVQVFVSGGTGGDGGRNSAGTGPALGGAGLATTAGLNVTAGETIYVGLGADGQDNTTGTAIAATSAFGIGPGGKYTRATGTGGGGGGASAIAVNDDIVVIAGGGGGAGGWTNYEFPPLPSSGPGGAAGVGSGSAGSDSIASPDSSAGGLGGSSLNGTPASTLSRTGSGGGSGEDSGGCCNADGGGGGAGYFGGLKGSSGGGDITEPAGGGGGGGASYTSSTRIPSTNHVSHALSSASPSGRIDYIDITTTSLASANTSVAYTASLAASFGVSGTPDQWSVSPALPTGITLDPSSGVVSGTASSASTGTYTFTATELSGDKLVARSSVSLGFSVVDPLAPTFDAPVATVDGYTVNVTNYDASFTWTLSVNAGSVTAGSVTGSTLPLTVTGLSAGASAITTVDTTRSGYANGTATVTGTALGGTLLTPTFDAPVATVDGYTVNVTNYDASFTWSPSVNAGSVSAGTVAGSTLPLTVTGLSAGASATTTVDTSRSGYTNGTATVTGSSASEPIPVPIPPAPILIVDVVPAPVHYGVVSHNGKCPVGWSVGGWEQWAGTQVCLLTSTYDGVSNTWIPGDYRTVMTQVIAWNAVPQTLRSVFDINLQSR